MRAHGNFIVTVLIFSISSLIWISPGVESVADFGRIKRFLGRNCHLIGAFMNPICGRDSGPTCCIFFGLVDICRTSCTGDFDHIASQSLKGLLADPALCSQIQAAGKQFCEFSNPRSCEALKCFMGLACFNGLTTCDQLPAPEPEVAAFEMNHQSRAFQFAELSACEATDLIKFDPENVLTCPAIATSPLCSKESLKYRTVDGSCNNFNHPDWGKSFAPAKRYLPAVYQDGVTAPRTLGKSGKPLKSPRYISRYVATEKSYPNDLSVMVMAFGQFIDHDFTGFPVIKLNDTDIKCCASNLPESMKVENGGPCFPITIESNDDFFQNRTCMEFIRSNAAMEDEETPITPREQINGLTSFLDASTVYGNTEEVNTGLRAAGGKLVTTDNNMLPPNNKSNCIIVDESTDYCIHTGDHRANVFVGLGILHTAFHREHNRLVDGLRQVNPRWDAETLYQEARKINAALHQHITYNEYLPAILNDATLDRYKLRVGDYTYDPSVDPNMANVFSTAAFRFGHSQVQSLVKVGNDFFKTEDTLMRPHLVLTRFDETTEGLAFSPTEDVDRHFAEAVTDHMFEKNKAKRDGLDLVSLNTQRGRDHGLPSYNDFREFCGLERVTSFSSPALESAHRLDKVYEDVDDIDVFIGGVCEERSPGSVMGPLFSCLLGQQFHDIKFGDRHFYETSSEREGFTPDQLREIKTATLSSVLCANTNIKQLQTRIMFMPNAASNPLVDCDKMKQIDLTKWKEVQ